MLISNSPLREKLTILIRENKDWAHTSTVIESISHCKKQETGRTSVDCFMYVFDRDTPRLELLSDFRELLGTALHLDYNEGDTVAFYFQGDVLMHVGLAQSGSVVLSKWGSGPVFLHPIHEVPSSYGCFILFTTKNAYLEAVKHLKL